MPNIKHILFPIDFSDRCCAAVPFVESVAGRYGAKITLLSVAQPIYFTGLGDPAGAMVVDTGALLNDVKLRLDTSLTREFSGLRVDRVAVLGDPAQEITEFAKSHRVDLIMMPTHGYGPFRSLLLGSVTAKVLHDAECPVWTAAHVEGAPCKDHLAVRNILCAIDPTAESLSIIKWAAELAKDTGATLRLLHAIPGMENPLAQQLDREFEEDMRTEARDTIVGLQQSVGLNVPICVTIGDVAKVVAEEARKHNGDAVVIGRGAMHEKLGRLRSHDYAIIRQAPCPVYSV
jgi:nucleotide-binding universal stress UspA family protein